VIIGQVIGSVWATRKEESLTGAKFLVVRKEKIENDSVKDDDDIVIAVDQIGAGKGDRVLVTSGSSAISINPEKNLPIDAAIIGIVDSLDL